MATAPEQSSSKSDDNISYAQWIKYFLKFSVLKNKSKGGDANKAKKCARDTIISLIQTEMNITVTDEQIRKSFNNKKTRLMAKVDRRKTGNVTETLTDDEKLFETFLYGDSSEDFGNPSLLEVPSGMEFGLSMSDTCSVSSLNSSISCAESLNIESDSMSMSPSTIMTNLTMDSPATTSGENVARKLTFNKMKRPPPPPISSKSKKSKDESALRMEVLEEQLKYFRSKNDKMNERDPLDRLFIEHLAGRVQSLEEQVQVLMSQRDE